MTEAPRSASPTPQRQTLATVTLLYRYFFYGWLFRDADGGSALERANALRHNRTLSRWLLTYLLRWSVVAALAAVCEHGAERIAPDSIAPGLFALLLAWATMYLLITAICWAFLADRQRRG